MRKPRFAIAALAIALSLTACSGSAKPAASVIPQSTTTYPVTVTTTSGDVTVTAQPTAIISLSPTATEMLFAIGAGTEVTAVDDQSNYPTDAPKSDLSGFTPNAEAIIGKKPDLVVISNDLDNIKASLSAANVPVLLLPAASTIDDTYSQLALLGTVTNHAGDATALVDSMKSRIAAAIASVKSTRTLSAYHELDNTGYSATSSTFIGGVYKAFGLTNIADAAPNASSGYPQLSSEYVVSSNPDLVFLADTKCCAVNAAEFAKRPGFAGLAAVTGNGVIALDDDIASRWGPRSTDLYEAVAAAINGLK